MTGGTASDKKTRTFADNVIFFFKTIVSIPLQEFQKTMGGKQPAYDTATRMGRVLNEKATLLDDEQGLEMMLSELRDKWDTVCGKSVER